MAGVVQIQKSSGETNEVSFEATDTVLDLKTKVEAACDVEVGRQRLVLGDQVLKPDSETIADLGVKPGSDVTLFTKRFPPPSRKDEAKIQALMAADDFEGLQKAAEEGYDLSVENGLYDVLHTAASNGDYDMVEMMLETGVSVFAITRQNPKTPLQVAAKYGQKKVCELLVQWGLDPHEKNRLTSDGSNRRIETWDAVQYAHKFPELAAWLAAQPSPKAPKLAPRPVTVLLSAPITITPDVPYEANTTVASFKAQMAEKFGFSPAELLMVSKGDDRELEDEKQMGDYDFKDPNKPDAHALVVWPVCPASKMPSAFTLKYKTDNHATNSLDGVKPSDTCGDVKKQILAFAKGNPEIVRMAQVNTADGLELFFAGKLMEADKKIADYQIGPKSEVLAFRQYDPNLLQTLMPKKVLMAAFPKDFVDGEFVQTPQNDTLFC